MITLKTLSKKRKFYIVKLHYLLLIALLILFFKGEVYANDGLYKTPKATSSYDCAPPLTLATIQPVRSGGWNNPTTWPGGRLPAANDDVIIPSGTTVTLLGNCVARSIRVNGVLDAITTQATGTWFNLSTEYIMVMGRFQVGTENKPYSSNEGGVITLKGNNPNATIPGTSVNSKAIMVMNGGRMELHGKAKKSWVKIGAKTPAGSKSIRLAEAVDWVVGDRIIITSNRLESKEAEERTIQSVSADRRTVFFNAALKFPRMGDRVPYSKPNSAKKWTVDTRAEVGLLNRNLKIQGDESNDGRGFGGHIMIMNNSVGNASNIELYKMGQRAKLARYPWHWHLLGNSGKGQFIKNSSIHKSYNRAITVHGTWGTLVDNNVAYDHVGHGIFLEDGSEINNVFSNNLVLGTEEPRKGQELLDTDRLPERKFQNASPSSFWITNPNNTFVNNVVAGTVGTAYWFAFPVRPTGLSAQDNRFKNMTPRKTKLGRFDGNVAHSCFNGIDINDGLNNKHELQANRSWDAPGQAVFNNLTFFANMSSLYSGIGDQQEDLVYNSLVSTDAYTHVNFATHHIIQNSIFIADTGNGLTNVPPKYRNNDIGAYKNPLGFFDLKKKALYRLYDGAGRVYDSHFVNWNRSDATLFDLNGAAQKRINHLFRGITYNHNGPANINAISPRTPQNNNADKCGQVWSNVIWDVDGSLTRTGKSSSIVTDFPFNRLDGQFQPNNWRGFLSVDNRFVFVYFNNQRVTVVRKDRQCNSVAVFRSDDCDLGAKQQLHLALDKGKYEHSIYFPELKGKSLSFKVESPLRAGDALTVRFKGFGRLNNVRIDGSNKVNSRAAVNNANRSSFYVENNGDVYAKFVTNNNILGANYTVRWNSGSLPNLTPEKPVACNDNSNNKPPTASFQSPTGNRFNIGANLGVVVNANDPDGTVANVRLYLNNKLVRQEGGAPYQWGTANAKQNDATLLNLSAGTYRLRAVATDNRGATTEISKNITVGSVSNENTIVHIRKRNDSRFALDGGTGGARGQNVKLWDANPANINQQWIEIDRGNGYYSYQKRNTGYCMDGGNGGDLRQGIILYDCSNTNQNQQWRKVAVGNNMFRLEKRNAGNFSIDGSGNNERNQVTYLWSSNNNNTNQHWIFELVDPTKNPLDVVEDLVLHPNPMQNTLFITGNTTDKQIKVYDLLGALKIEKHLIEGGNKIDVSGLSKGVYMVRVIDINNNVSDPMVYKIVKAE